MTGVTRNGAVASAICALALLWPEAAAACHVPGPSARNEVSVLPLDTRKPKSKPMPAPAPSDHLATPEENPLAWKI